MLFSFGCVDSIPFFHFFICLEIKHKSKAKHLGFCAFPMIKGLSFSPIILAVSARVILKSSGQVSRLVYNHLKRGQAWKYSILGHA